MTAQPVIRKMFEVIDLSQLIRMFHAGGGTFFFLNLHTGRKFCLQFKRQLHPTKNGLYYSEVHVSFNDGLPFHLGRYDFKYQIMQLSDETNGYSYERLKLFIDSFKFVRNNLISGKGFTNNYKVFYDGTCCRCGKRLESTASVKIGFGPECEELVNEYLNQQLKVPV